MPHEIIRTEQLTKAYVLGEMEVPILHGIDMVINQGEYVALMGPSGSGKSTLMNIIGCLDVATSGSYFLDGIDVGNCDKNDLARIRGEKIGFVFQNFNLLSRETALENVELPLVYGTTSKQNRKHKAVQALEAVGLTHRMSHRPNELSGGERQRVAIARALINDPTIILADEPTGNLDSKSGRQIMEIFDQLHGEGRTIIMVTHGEDIAARAGRILTIRDGYLQTAPPRKSRRPGRTAG